MFAVRQPFLKNKWWMRAFLQQVLYVNFDLRGHKQLTSLRQHQYILTFKKLLILFYRSTTSQIFYKEFFWKCFRNSQENNLSRISYFNQQPFWKVILPRTISLKYLNLFTETVFQSICKCVFFVFQHIHCCLWIVFSTFLKLQSKKLCSANNRIYKKD